MEAERESPHSSLLCECGHALSDHNKMTTGAPCCDLCKCAGFRDRPSPLGDRNLPGLVGLKPLDHPWVAEDNGDGTDVVIYVQCVTDRGIEVAHVLFEDDWGSLEDAEHIVKLHNDWLAAKVERGY